MATVTVHDDAPAGTWRLETVMVVAPAVAIVAPTALAQVPPTAGVAAICNPDGNESMNPTLEIAGLPAGLDTVNVNVVVPPVRKVVGENDLVSVGVTIGLMVSVSVLVQLPVAAL